MFPLRRGDTSLKTSKPKLREAHTQFTTHGMGNFYGTGAKNPMGRIRTQMQGIAPVSRKQLGTPPKSVV